MTAAVATIRGDVALGIIAAAGLHVAAAVFLFSAPEARQAVPRMLPMRTHMVAAPQGDVSVGVVQAPATPTETPAPRAAEKVPDPTKTAPTATKQAPRIKPKEATVTPNAAKSVKNAPTAGSE